MGRKHRNTALQLVKVEPEVVAASEPEVVANIGTRREFKVSTTAAWLAERVEKEVLRHRLAKLSGPCLSRNASKQELATLIFQLEGGQGNQQKVAGILIDLTLGEGKPCSADELQRVLKEAFPQANVGDRHAAHYLSKARTGHLPCVRDGLVVPTAPRQSKPKPADKPATEVVAVALVAPSTPAEALAAAAG